MAYAMLAAAFVREDRKTHRRTFINLPGMMSAIVTAPIAFPLEYLGWKMDSRSNLQIGAAIIGCSVLVFGCVAALWRVVALASTALPIGH